MNIFNPRVRKQKLLAVAAFFLLQFVFCFTVNAGENSRSTLLSSKIIAHWSIDQTNDFFYKSDAIQKLAALAPNQVTELGRALNGINFYKIVYETTDFKGNLIIASGLLAIPDKSVIYDRNIKFSLVNYLHGTLFDNKAAPSSIDKCGEAGLIAFIYAGHGLAAAMPDYTGMGEKQSFHQYLHPESEAIASADFLIAVSEFFEKRKNNISNKILVTGFSQGGQVALALQKELEKNNINYKFAVAANAPIAGVYDITAMLKSWIDKPDVWSVPVTLRLFTAYDKIYNLSSDWNNIFKAPYNQTAGNLFDNGSTEAELKKVPADFQNLFTADYLKKLANASNNSADPLIQKFNKNNILTGANFKAPIRLYHGKSDPVIKYKIARDAYRFLKAKGAAIELINVGDDITHIEALIPASIDAKKWFEKINK